MLCDLAQVGGRVNVRLRMKLMDSLLVQGECTANYGHVQAKLLNTTFLCNEEIGFFDTTKTGDLTSRRKSHFFFQLQMCTWISDVLRYKQFPVIPRSWATK